MTPSDAARLSALEARLAATCQAVYRLSRAVKWTGNHEQADAAMSAMMSGHLHSGPPSPPAAEGEADRVERARRAFGDALSTRVNMRTYLGDIPVYVLREAMAEALAVATPGPSPETIARVRELLTEHARWSGPGTRSGRMAAEALHLLDAEPRESPVTRMWSKKEVIGAVSAWEAAVRAELCRALYDTEEVPLTNREATDLTSVAIRVLAPHLAARDAATWAQACEACALECDKEAATCAEEDNGPGASEAYVLASVIRHLAPPQPQSGGTGP